MSLSFGLYPNIYATGNLSGLRQMLEELWIRKHQSGNGSVYIVSGFANYNGGARFYKTLAEHVDAGGRIVAVFGGSTSQRLASRQVVEALLECGARVIIINRKRILHAKLYGSRSETGVQSLVLSSGNFTGPGLTQNIEASLLVDHVLLSQAGFDWEKLIQSMVSQKWLLYEPMLSKPADPAWQLLYDETPGKVVMDESEEVTMILRLGNADTQRIRAKPGTPQGKGSQYFWLSKDCFDFFPPLTTRNARGIKGSLSTKISLEYVDLNVTRTVRVTFEAENNLDFRLGTGALRYKNVAAPGDLACITRLGESNFQLRIIRTADPLYQAIDGIAVSHTGNSGKRYGFVSNHEFSTLLKIQLP